MEVKKHTNRYGDEFIFTLQPDGNILWEGPFKYLRWGHPNDYTQAFFQYLRDTGKSSTLEEFKELVHESIYDENDRYVGPGEVAEKYGHMVVSRYDIIDMVDPSGGPYMTSGMDFMGKTIKEFKTHGESSYLIITENETKED